MASDFNKPVVTDTYSTLVPALQVKELDMLRWLEPTLTGAHTNLPAGAIRLNAGNNTLERYSGTAWSALTFTVGSGTATTGLFTSLGASGNLSSATRVDAPIYYDSNNTAYYLDPAGTSVLNTVQAATTDGSYLRVTNPSGGTYVSSTASVVGALKITFPLTWTNSMLRVTVKVYEYATGESFEVHFGGYNYSTSSTWVNNPFAYIVGNPSANNNLTVRFGYTAGGKCVVYIGELATSWAYPQFFITEAQFGYSGYQVGYTTGWSCGIEATAFENVTATISNVQVGQLSTTTPAALGTAAVGTSTTVARADHVHLLPTAATLGVPTTTGTGASGTWSIAVTGNAGTVTNGVYTTGTNLFTGAGSFRAFSIRTSDASANNWSWFALGGTSDSAGNVWHIATNGTAQDIGLAGALHIRGANGAATSLTINQDHTIRFKTSNLYAGATTNADGNLVWHAGNDGASSGLDADLLDGNHASAFATVGQVHYVGTTSIAANRSSAAQSLTGITSIDGNSAGVNSFDPDRTLATPLPTGITQAVKFQFANASAAGTGGNYAGIMTYSPWLGTTASTGDASYQLAFGSTAVNGGGVPKLNIRKGIDSTWNSWYTLIHTGNTARATWNTYATAITLVAGEMAWKNYGDNHTIFDASAGTAPDGTAKNNTNPDVAWTATYPTLMGWNGTNTYGVRVDSSRYADTAAACSGNAATVTNGVYTTSAYIGVANTTNTNGYGISLYNGPVAGQPTYGLMFQGTATFGTHGSVTGDWATYFTMDNTANRGWIFRNVSTGNMASISNAGNFNASGNVTAYSDERLKKDLVKIDNALSKVRTLTGYTYTRIATNERNTGLLAQDVRKVLPEAVMEGEYLSLAYGNMVGLLVEAIKEQQVMIEELYAKLQ